MYKALVTMEEDFGGEEGGVKLNVFSVQTVHKPNYGSTNFL
tara:strand:- start:391 stop:513 length:123 start_codon:yes stop_codon:yes gene_type:complete